MNLLGAFDINRTGHELISLVGAGGKTTTMFALAQALKALSKRVLVSTTTNLFYPAQEECDRVIVSEAVGSGIFNAIPDGSVTVFGKGVVEERKLAGDFTELDIAFNSIQFPDNINKTYSTNGSAPKETANFTIYGTQIDMVPVANSTRISVPDRHHLGHG